MAQRAQVAPYPLARPVSTRPPRRGGDHLLRAAGKVGLIIQPAITYFFLWAPILLLVIFSFNNSRQVSSWNGFTLQWYSNILNNIAGTEARFTTQIMLETFGNSLIVAFAATGLATVIGTMVALSLERGEYPGKGLVQGLLFLPVVIPEITSGIALLIFFNVLFDFAEGIGGSRPALGFGSIIIGHVVFNISYVAIVVRARLANMNPQLEEAAGDLGANAWRAFWRVTFPLILPGIISGGLLAFTLSLDDFVTTFFLAGVGTTTLPVFVYGLLKISITPEINAISTIILVLSTLLIGAAMALQGRDAGKI